MRGSLIVALLGAASLAGACASTPVAPEGPSNKIARGAGADLTRPGGGSIAGDWREFWGEPGDLSYNDEYRIEVAASGEVTVAAMSRDQPISETIYRGGVLTFTQQTSFPVRYRLALSRDRARLEGTATTPELQAQIRWERIVPGAPAP